MRGSKLESRLIRTMERFVLTRADLVLPMGSFTKGIAESAGVPPERIVELVFPTSWGGASGVGGDDEGVDRGRVVCAARFARGQRSSQRGRTPASTSRATGLSGSS